MRDEVCAGESAPTRPGGPADDDSVTTEGGTRPARGSARQRARAVEPTMTPRQPQEEVLPALDGHGVDIVFERTSRLTRAECAELMEYVYAWGAQHGVRFSAAEDGL